MGDKKIIIEQNNQTKEVKQEELDNILKNPNFKVKEVKETDKEKKVIIQEMLYD